MGELHLQGKSMEEISNSLKNAPLYENTISAIKSAYALGYVLCSMECIIHADAYVIMLCYVMCYASDVS